ncbi:MAG: large conductance mechanosensitive channel protein MscL [Peptostreptococcus porci]|uniref:large conductance mechanosensitive channel protein MscL n=1 Tax=Peptostreptococcus porci TaxID=2652282 RepID=UPI002A757019|nr:large conductance mechanosensitive channel protein MscL [Peptostreptococcus porci]MDY2795077.1 large conductance mechanosensitive channel protein MscL [Peptostreptococcus porci]MDY4560160.1 large conductance mechanosensitive channel protein MscL [Peptostreptococcus porci]MDY5479328.1 large conductance mechanosensitive channel protein MscL [Peptostreptococcus porci]MDY6231464.1 large conductance mechanosensitive channel protein MscL [Peptostreptococcus porci]
MKGFMKEFKEFAMKGNVLDMAVGVVIGAAFGAIVTALVEKVIMPLVGIIAGGVDISGLAVKVGSANLEYGAFLQAIINFLIIAFSVFVFVKIINTAAGKFKKEEEVVEEVPAVDPQLELLTEIRDLLAKK